MLPSTTMVITLQYISIPNQYACLKFTQYVKYISIKGTIVGGFDCTVYHTLCNLILITTLL